MKHTRNIFLVSLLLASLEFAWTGCVGPGDGGEVVYGGVYGGGPWFRTGSGSTEGGAVGTGATATPPTPTRPVVQLPEQPLMPPQAAGVSAPSGGSHGGGNDHR